MANPYVLVGAAQGLEQARRRFRDERMEEEDRGERKSELEYARGRRAVRDTREDEQYGHEQEERPLRRRALEAQVEGAEVSTDAARTGLQYAKADRPLDREGKEIGLEAARDDLAGAKTSRAREGEMYGLKIKQIRKSMEEEGMGRFLDALEGGADPEYAVKLFNAQGKNGIRPGTTKYDKKSGQISFTGKDGEVFNGTTAQLRSLLLPKDTTKPITVPSGGSLYNPKTGQWAQPPGGAAGGRKISPFNPQTHGKQTRDLVIQSLGGEWDNTMQRFKIPAGMGEKVSYGTSLADQVIKMTEEEGLQLGPGEVSNIVTSALRDVRTTGQAMKAARSSLGDNADQESITSEAERIVDDSKIKAATALKNELDMVRSKFQQQQVSRQFPTAPDGSEDMEGGEGMEAPPAEYLREGYSQQFQDGSEWTLQNGQPVRVK